jgi:hypothetical protein
MARLTARAIPSLFVQQESASHVLSSLGEADNTVRAREIDSATLDA